MKFLKDAEPVSTDDFWYDLTTGGCINPEKMLEKEYAKRVNDAIKVIQEFEEQAEKNDLIMEL